MRLKICLTLLLLLSVAASGMAQDVDPANTLEVGHFFKSGGLDPMAEANLSEFVYYDPLFDTLVTLDAEGNFLPRLATEWEVTPEQVTFTLREGVSFSDGTPFNAAAVVANYDYAVTEGNGTPRVPWNNVTSVEALDDFTVRFHLAQDDPFFLQFMAQYAGMMVSPAAFGDADNNPVGVGPFVYNADESIAGSRFVYDRNPDYWDAESVALDRIVIRNLNAPDTANAYLAGDVDVSFVSAAFTPLLADTDATFLPARSSIDGLMVWDRDGSVVPELAEQEFRCALAQAVSTEGYVNALGGLVFEELRTMPPSGSYGASDVTGPAYDPEAAAEAIRAGGYEGVTIAMPASPNQRNGHEALTGQFSALGVNVDTTLVEGSDFYASIFRGEYPMSLFNFSNEHFIIFVETHLLADSPRNPFGAVDEDIQALYEEAQGLSLAEAEPLYEEISRLFNERCYFMPGGIGGIGIATAPHVEGAQGRFSIANFISLRDVSLNR